MTPRDAILIPKTRVATCNAKVTFNVPSNRRCPIGILFAAAAAAAATVPRQLAVARSTRLHCTASMKDARKIVPPRHGHFNVILAGAGQSCRTTANITLKRS